MLAACAVQAAPAQPQRDGAQTEFVGIWSCLVYGPYGEQRFFLRFAADGGAGLARATDAVRGRFVPLSEWRERGGEVRFTEPQTQRRYSARRHGPALGGSWREGEREGGFWCAPVPGEDAPRAARRAPPAETLMQSLVPTVMASPPYPRQALREAREGRSVCCFFVSGDGTISNAVVVELTDEIFRLPTLTAVTGSRYREWGDRDAVLPACRSFTFELEAVD